MIDRPKSPPITGSHLIDLEMHRVSRPFRVYEHVVGSDARRREAAQKAWNRLNAFLLPEDIFSNDEFTILTTCIDGERTRRNTNTPTAIPQPADPDAETLLPTLVDEDLPIVDADLLPTRPTPTRPPPLPKKEKQLSFPPSNSAAEKLPVAPVFFEQQVSDAKAKTQIVVDKSKQLTLPAVAEPERSAPTLWFRSAIFRVIQRGKRENVFEKPLPTPWVKGQLLFTGPELDQSDLDVMLQAVHMAASQGLVDQPLVFSDKAMLHSLGKTYSSGNREWLRVSLSRLTSSKITVKIDGDVRGREYQFLREQAWDNGRRAVIVTESAVKLFADEGYTVLQWAARLSLTTSLSKWLHGFLMSQPSTTNGLGLSLIKDLSGTPPSRPMKLFKHDMKAAVAALSNVDDPHLGLVSIAVVDGKEGPKLMWKRQPNRRQALQG
jgi:hypothetical protein